MEKTYEERIAICKNCPIARFNHYDNTIRCDSGKYLSPDGTKSSYLPKAGWFRGCGCVQTYAAKNPSKHCVAGKW